MIKNVPLGIQVISVNNQWFIYQRNQCNPSNLRQLSVLISVISVIQVICVNNQR